MTKLFENLSNVRTGSTMTPKTSSEADFYQFWLDFGVPRGAQKHQKWIKNKPKKQQKNRRQKITKKQKKGSKLICTAECASRGEDKGGEKKTSKTAKNDAKNWRQKLKQKTEGKRELEDEDKMLKGNLRDDLARRTRGRRSAPRIPPYPTWRIGY